MVNYNSAKGQLISKCLFDVFNFFQKANKKTSPSSRNEFIRFFFLQNSRLDNLLSKLTDLYKFILLFYSGMVNQIHSVNNIWAILVGVHKEKQQLHCSLRGISRVFAIMIVIVFSSMINCIGRKKIVSFVHIRSV